MIERRFPKFCLNLKRPEKSLTMEIKKSVETEKFSVKEKRHDCLV